MLDYHPETLERVAKFKRSSDKTIGLDVLILLIDSKDNVDTEYLFKYIYSYRKKRKDKKVAITEMNQIIKNHFYGRIYSVNKRGEITESETFDPLKKCCIKNDKFVMITVKDDSTIKEHFNDPKLFEYFLLQREEKKTNHLKSIIQKSDSKTEKAEDSEKSLSSSNLLENKKKLKRKMKNIENVEEKMNEQTRQEENVQMTFPNENANAQELFFLIKKTMVY